MGNIVLLEQEVHKLYIQKHQHRDDWADWMMEGHVIIVANYASSLAKKYKANTDLCRASALLHDIADVKMKRENPKHEQESLNIAKELMKKTGFNKAEIDLVVNDAILYHSCHDGKTPKSLEGKILATADSLAHLKTDFYIYATWAKGKNNTYTETKNFVLSKIEKDYNVKILFKDEKVSVKEDYLMIKKLFSR